MFKSNTQGGFSLIGLLVAIVIIAALGYGSSLFFQKTKTDTAEQAKVDLEKHLDTIQQKAEDNKKMAEEIMNEGEKEDVELEKNDSDKPKTEKEEVEINEKDLDTNRWRDVVRENDGFKIKYPGDWYYTINYKEAKELGYDLIIGFDKTEDIWEATPPFPVELIISSTDKELDEKQVYSKEVDNTDNKKYTIATPDKDYKDIVDKMTDTFELINKED